MDATEFNGLDDWQVVCQMLPTGWRQMAKSTGALRRARRMPDADVLLRVLLIHLADGCSLTETAVRARATGLCAISSVGLFKRLAASEHWLRWMAEQLWRRRSVQAAPTDYRLRAVDATTVQEPGNTGTDGRLHYVIRLEDLRCDHFELTDVKGGETFRRVPVSAGDLIMGDRVYGTPPGVAHVTSRQGAVLVRINLHNLPLFTRSGAPFPVLRRARTLRVGQVRAWPAWVHYQGRAIAGRLVAVRRSASAAQLARKRLRRTASKKGWRLSSQALAAAHYVFVWTTTPDTALKPRQVMDLYRLRWQIELTFKRMKSILGLGHLPQWSDASARAWIHGKLFIALRVEQLLWEAEDFSPWGYRLDAAPQPLA